jgi:hypothetical protein
VKTTLYTPASEVLSLIGNPNEKLEAFLSQVPRKKKRRKRSPTP